MNFLSDSKLLLIENGKASRLLTSFEKLYIPRVVKELQLQNYHLTDRDEDAI